MANWTKTELETLTPFETATRQIGSNIVAMTRSEYDAWIASAVGCEKDDDALPDPSA